MGRVHIPSEGIQNLLFVVEAAPVINTAERQIDIILREAHVDTYSDQVELPPLLPRDVGIVDVFDFVPVPTGLQIAEQNVVGDDGTTYVQVRARVDDPNAAI